MSIDTFTLQCFLAVVETKNFTKAAQKVGRTQSAISQQMNKLEALLGKSLYWRGKTFTLTAEGEIFLSYARQIFSLHNEVLDRFKEPDLEGEVKFGLPEDFSSVFLSSVLSDFVKLHPRVLLNIECNFTINLFERFQRKEFDLVLLKRNLPQDFPYGVEIWSEPLVWVGNMAKIDNHETLPLILSHQPCVYRTSALQALEQVNRKWRLVFTSPSYVSTIAAIKAGMGITVLPRTMVPDHIEVITSNLLPQLADTHVCLLKQSSDNVAINSFEKFVLEKIKR